MVRKKDNPLPVGAKIKAKKTCPIANFLPDLARAELWFAAYRAVARKCRKKIDLDNSNIQLEKLCY